MENYTVFSTATPNSPALGTWKTNQKVIDSNGIIWQCTVPGSPGTWTQVGGNSGALTLISRQVLAAPVATVTFSSIPQTYENLVLVAYGQCSDAAINANITMQVNGDTAAHYSWSAGNSGGWSNNGGALVTFAQISQWPAGNSSGYVGQFRLFINGYTRTVLNKVWGGLDNFSQNGNPSSYTNIVAGFWQPASPAAITSLAITDGSGGDFVAGSVFALYGES